METTRRRFLSLALLAPAAALLAPTCSDAEREPAEVGTNNAEFICFHSDSSVPRGGTISVPREPSSPVVVHAQLVDQDTHDWLVNYATREFPGRSLTVLCNPRNAAINVRRRTT